MTDVRKIEKFVGWGLLLAGLISFAFPFFDARIFFYTIAVIVTLSALSFIVKAIKSRRVMDWGLALLLIILAGALWSHEALGRTLIVYFFAFYMLVNGLVYLVQSVLDFREESKNKWVHLAMTAIYLFLAWYSVFMIRKDVRIIMYYFAIYLLIVGFEMLSRGYSIFDIRSGRDYLMRYWIAMPVYFVFLVPSLFIRRMEDRMKVGEDVPLFERKNDEKVNFRVYVHSGLSGEKIAGHMTLSCDDIMYSYGNYDAAKEKFFRSIGPGVFFTVPAKAYVNNSCIYEGSILFEFGLHLSQEQLEIFHHLIDEMLSQSYRWLCPIEAQAEGRFDFKKYEKDYASRLSYRTGAKFREFHKGQWKHYWIFGENCSVFAEYCLKEMGLNILPKLGIVTPGEYFVYFTKAFSDPDSPVITKSWHAAQYPDSLFKTIA